MIAETRSGQSRRGGWVAAGGEGEVGAAGRIRHAAKHLVKGDQAMGAQVTSSARYSVERPTSNDRATAEGLSPLAMSIRAWARRSGVSAFRRPT